MDIKEVVGTLLKDLIVPELDKIKEENKEIKAILLLTNKRIDDINLHLADQSRRIDETNKRIDNLRVELRDEMAKTNSRIDRLYEVIVRRDEHNKLDERVAGLEREVSQLKQRAA